MLRCIGLVLGAALLVAMEPPSGVIAVVSNDPVDEPGASAVVVAEGLAITLAEALPAGAATVAVVVPPGRRRTAAVEWAGELARLRLDTAGCAPLAPAAGEPALGDAVWTVGNAGGAIELDGRPALSRGGLSGRYELPAGTAPLRGRGGRVPSRLTGEVLEVDAGVNDGLQGGALLDRDGRLAGLITLAQARERRLGTALSLARIAAAAGLPAPATAGPDPLRAPLALVRLERPRGLGNPALVPRPPRPVAAAPIYERERLQRWWDAYYHFQQVAWTDQPASALVVDAEAGLLLTAASNLHGGAERGRVALPGGGEAACTVVAVNQPLDLALLRCDRPLPWPAARLAARRPAAGEAVQVAGLQYAAATRTTGRVTVVGRRAGRSAASLLQIDARCNYGSLGGAVLGTDGTVLGLVVMLGPLPEWPWYINSGVAMAVDARTIAAALPELRAGTSRTQLPVLGLGIRIDPGQEGVVVAAVLPGTGAAAAGVKAGDRVVGLDGRPVASHPALARALIRRQAGERVRLELRRDGHGLEASVELREFE